VNIYAASSKEIDKNYLRMCDFYLQIHWT